MPILICIASLFFLLLHHVHSLKYSIQCFPHHICPNQLMATYISQTGSQSKDCVRLTGQLGCPTLKNQFQLIQNCQKDERGNECPSNICVKAQPLEHCFAELNGAECPSVLDGLIQPAICQDCKQKDCQKCIVARNVQVCFSQNECPLDFLNTYFESCSDGVDTYGDTCKCCAKTKSNVQLSLCSNLVPLFNTEKFKMLYQSQHGRENDGDTDQNGENEESGDGDENDNEEKSDEEKSLKNCEEKQTGVLALMVSLLFIDLM